MSTHINDEADKVSTHASASLALLLPRLKKALKHASLVLPSAALVMLFGFNTSQSDVFAQSGTAADVQQFIRTITISPGDTLTHIALRELGDETQAREIADLNGLGLNDILKPGDLLQIPGVLPVRDEFARVLFTKGFVQINGKAAQPDDELRLNDAIETGATGYASLTFESGTLINLHPNTLARIVTLHCQPLDDTCVIEMATDKGQLTTDVRRDRNQPTDFRVQTPYASAAVRGTVFDIDADDNGLRIGVTEGAIALGSNDSDQAVDLDTGFGSVNAPGAPLGEPIALLPAPVFRYVPPRIATGDTLRWFGLTETPRYTVQIAASPNGVGIAYDTSVTTDSFTLEDDIAIGDYSVLLRAIDINGLRGFTATSPITVALTDDNLPEVDTAIAREASNFRVRVEGAPENIQGFEIQLATDEDFSDPVSVDVDATGDAIVRVGSDTLFARSRILISRTVVGPFGPAARVE